MRARLAAGEPLFGIFSMFAEPALVEIAGLAGFDYAILDTEHGPTGQESLQNCLRAGDAVGLPCLVRVPQNAAADMQRALDSGAAGIVAPHVRTADDARALVAACRYPPFGERGTAFTARHGGYGLHAPARTRARADDALIVAQIEDAAALEVIEPIAAVDGLDSLFVGPADLAVSLGLSGAEGRAAVDDALHGTVAPAAAAAGRIVGTFVSDADEALAQAERGCALLAMSGTSLIAGAHRSLIDTYRNGRAAASARATKGSNA